MDRLHSRGIGRASVLLCLTVLVACNGQKSVETICSGNGAEVKSFPTVRESWSIASPPLNPAQPWTRLPTRNEFAAEGYQGLFDPALLWFNPYVLFQDTSVYDTIVNKKNSDRRIHVLTLEFRPQRSLTGPPGAPNTNAWGGIMRGVSRGQWNLAHMDYLELRLATVRRGAQAGTLHIDLGRITEDVNDNGRLDTEDKARGVSQFRNNLLDDDEDTGTDGLPDSLEIGPNGEVYDPVLNPDPAGDNWYYDTDLGFRNDYDHIDGTENSIRDPVRGLRPDTEDLGGELEFDRENAYFEYSIVLDDLFDPALVAGTEKLSGDVTQFADRLIWHTYQIPLWDAQRRSVTPYPWIQPDSTAIEYARIWLAGADSTVRLYLAEISLVDTTGSR